ncbi:hypothetical protein AAV10_24050, partial [Enterobacter hormaechei]
MLLRGEGEEGDGHTGYGGEGQMCIRDRVNNAGITQRIKLMDIKREKYEAVVDGSRRGTLRMSQAVIPTMRAQKSGS